MLENNHTIHLTLNGEIRAFTVEPQETLLHVLRERAHLTGAKKGCDLEDLTDEELQAIDKRVTKELLGDISIKSCVNARVSFGGTAPSEVHRQIEVGRQWLNSLER